MNFNDYQQLANTTAIYPATAKVFYPALGMAGEVGEVCEKIKKHVRDGRELNKEELKKEIGDVLWYMSALCTDLGITLEDVATTNYNKLKSRQERNVLSGSGDNR